MLIAQLGFNESDWVAGISIGAINVALIAGRCRCTGRTLQLPSAAAIAGDLDGVGRLTWTYRSI
jgi:hypothetical protein